MTNNLRTGLNTLVGESDDSPVLKLGGALDSFAGALNASPTLVTNNLLSNLNEVITRPAM